MGASQGKGKNQNENDKEKKSESNNINSEKEKEKEKEKKEKQSGDGDEESGEESDENSEENENKISKKNNQEKENSIKPLKTESNNKEDSNSEEETKNKNDKENNSNEEKLKDFSQEEEKEEKESKNSSELNNNSKKEGIKDTKNTKSQKEYKDILPGEIPEERKISNPNKLSFHYNCVQTIELAHKKEITTLAYILRRNEIATGSVDETIKIWKINIEKNKISLNKELKGHTDSILCIKDFPKLNCFCSTSADNTLKLWNCKSLKCISTLIFHTKCVLSCSYNPLGKQEIFSGGEDLIIVIWTKKGEKDKDLENYENRYVLKGHKKRISALTYIDDYDYLASGSDDKTLRIWELKNIDDIKCIKVIKDLLSPIDYLLYLDNRLLVSCEDGVISFIKMNKKKRCRSVKFSNVPVYSFNIFHKHKYLLVGSKDGKARIWKIGTNKREVLKGHKKAITGVTDFEDNFIITVSIDCSMKLWKKE